MISLLVIQLSLSFSLSVFTFLQLVSCRRFPLDDTLHSLHTFFSRLFGPFFCAFSLPNFCFKVFYSFVALCVTVLFLTLNNVSESLCFFFLLVSHYLYCFFLILHLFSIYASFVLSDSLSSFFASRFICFLVVFFLPF